MLWLSADFQSERKRQISQAKKLSNAIKQYHATLHTRKIRERAEFEAKVRRLAARLNRNVQRDYWKKIERVVGYKQRLDGEEQRRKDMDKHLVFLVRQTEKYGESLTKRSTDGGGGDGEGGGDGDDTTKQQMTIEEALSQSSSLGRRKSTLTVVDYSRMDQDDTYNEGTFYGERLVVVNNNNNSRNSTLTSPTKETDDDGGGGGDDDDEYEPSESELMQEAENEKIEYVDFLNSFREQCPDEVRDEVNKLLEEQEMDLDALLQRLVEEGQLIEEKKEEEEEDDTVTKKPSVEEGGEPMEIEESTTAPPRTRHVSFAASHQERTFDPSPSVESILGEDDHEEKDEFHLENEEVDDETTIEAEERLGRDMSYKDEIELLNRENEMSIEELRAKYANMEDGSDESVGSNDNDDETETNDFTMLAEDDHEEKDEFHLEHVEVDDETTIEAEEKLGRDMSYQEEIDLLKRESEMSVEELRAMYANLEDGGGDSNNGGEASTANSSALDLLNEDDHEEKDEFHMEEEEMDDETTIEAEEKLGRDISYEQELSQLQEENEMSTEELRRLYGLDADEDGAEIATQKPEKRKHEAADSPDNGKSTKKAKNDDSDEGIAALKSLAASDEKARQTMLTRPFLLASWVKLRAYQQVGMNWLVSTQSRRLNGILADEMGLGELVETLCCYFPCVFETFSL